MNQTAPTAPDAPSPPAGKGIPRRMLVVVLGLLGLTVTVHGIALVYALSAHTDLVRTDYYEHGEAWDEELARLATGTAAGLTLTLSPGADGGTKIALTARAGVDGRVARLHVYRPDDAARDLTVELRPVAERPDGMGASWQGQMAALGPGLWRVRADVEGQPPMSVALKHMVEAALAPSPGAPR